MRGGKAVALECCVLMMGRRCGGRKGVVLVYLDNGEEGWGEGRV